MSEALVNPPSLRARITLGVVAALVGMIVALLLASVARCPSNTLSFGTRPNIMCMELAFTSERNAATLATWRAPEPRLAQEATHETHLDYGFLAFYGGVLAWSGRYGARRLTRRGGRSEWVLSWATLVAALFDALENVGLLSMLRAVGTPSATVSAITSTFAAAKFLLLTVWVGVALAVSVAPSRTPTS